MPGLRFPFCLRLTASLLFLPAAAFAGAHVAQTKGSEAVPARSHAKAQGPSRTASRNMKVGEIVALDIAAESITLKARSGATATYTLTTKTKFWKNRRPAQAADFKAGDAVVLHVRSTGDDDLPHVLELADPTTWNWLGQLRRNITPATITQIEESELTVTLVPEAVPMTYRINDSTRWSRAEKDATPGQFHAGDRVYIVPRSLPSGGIAARVVVDSAGGAAQVKESLARILSGTVQSIDRAAHTVTLQTKAGSKRTLHYTEATEVRQGSQELSLEAIKPGQHVSAHLKHDSEGEDSLARLQFVNQRSKTPRKRPSEKTTTKGGMGSPKPLF